MRPYGGGLWDGSPLDRAVYAAGIGPGPLPPQLTPEEYLAGSPRCRWPPSRGPAGSTT